MEYTHFANVFFVTPNINDPEFQNK
jgi:hypothetical protein